MVINLLFHIIWEVGFAGRKRAFLVVGVAVILAVAEFFHQLRRRVADVHRHFECAEFACVFHCETEGLVHRVALCGAGHVHDRLRNREFAFGTAEALKSVPGIQRDFESARVRIADIFGCHAHHSPCDVDRVAAAVEHAREPVQRLRPGCCRARLCAAR